MKNTRFIKFLPAIGWFFFVLVLICLPGDGLPHVDDWFQKFFVDKFIHAALFGMLAFLFMYPFFKMDIHKNVKVQYFLRIALALSIWGLTTEFIQKFYIPYRSFDLGDWLADSIGIFLAFLYCRRIILQKQ